jgi:hypothetical protein
MQQKSPQKAPTKAPTNVPTQAPISKYNIQLDLSGITTAADQAIFASAAAKWESIITEDLSNINTRGAPPREDNCTWPSVIDDLFICSGYKPIDGRKKVLGFSGPEYVRNSNGLPISGTMTFDTADLTFLRGNGGEKFLNTILHKKGHVLGTQYVVPSRFNAVAILTFAKFLYRHWASERLLIQLRTAVIPAAMPI